MVPEDKTTSNNSRDDYRLTSQQLDNTTTTVITTLLSGFIVAQSYLPKNTNNWYKTVATFAVVTLLAHYVSFVSAHFAQIYAAKKKDQLSDYFGKWTQKINNLVYVFVVAEFLITIVLIVIKK
jgi:hypothetical protein